MQQWYRLLAGQPRCGGKHRAQVAPGSIDGHRRLEKPRKSDLPPHARAARWATEWHWTGADFTPWTNLDIRAPECGSPTRAWRYGGRRYRQPYLPRVGRR